MDEQKSWMDEEEFLFYSISSLCLIHTLPSRTAKIIKCKDVIMYSMGEKFNRVGGEEKSCRKVKILSAISLHLQE